MVETDWYGKSWSKITVGSSKFDITYDWCLEHDSPHEFTCYYYGYSAADYYFENENDALLFRLKFEHV